MEPALREEIVAKLGVAFGGARDVTPDPGQPLHVVLDALELPSGWEPNPTRALTVWDAWPTVMVKVAEPLAPVESVTVTVTEYVPAAVGLPEMRPEGLMDKPGGRPVLE